MSKPNWWGQETTPSMMTEKTPLVEPIRAEGLTLEDIQAAARPVILSEPADPAWLRDANIMGGARARRRARRNGKAE